jgi:glycosyltransferase involved in cell wall biosynthesis
MAQQKLRVLLDLSMAVRGYCGIAQDVRLLYKILASCPEVEVTGLVYHPRRFGSLHKFLPPGAPRADRLANQASFLWALAEGAMVWPDAAPLRAAKILQHLAATICAPRVKTDLLDMQMLGDVIWRSLFAQTLSPKDLSLVQNGEFLLSNLSNGMIYARALLNRRPFRIDTRGYDFLIVQSLRPFRTSPETCQIVRCHDMIPVTQPDTVSNPMSVRLHHRAIQQCGDGAFFVCNSEPTRDDLTAIYPELRQASTTIPAMLADVYRPDPNPDLVRSIIDLRRSEATGARPAQSLPANPQYVMCVSTLEPRKNFVTMIQAFHALKIRPSVKQKLPDLKLLMVGSPGWKFEPILAAMRGPVERGDLIHLEHVTPEELRVLYTHSQAFVFPSLAEGFGSPPLEAMVCDVPVIASDIAAHHWVLGDAALYCNPYDLASIASTIERLLASDESTSLRAEMIARGRERVKRYSLERCSRTWVDLLTRLKQNSSGGRGGAARPKLGEDGVLKRVA